MPPIREKRARLKVIAELLSEERPIGTQAELVEALRERGVRATQSSVSRDLLELEVKRVKGRYLLKSAREGEAALGDVVGFIREVKRHGPHLTMMTTAPFAAELVAETIDAAEWPELLGAIGDDCRIFLATAGQKEQDRLFKRLGAMKLSARFIE